MFGRPVLPVISFIECRSGEAPRADLPLAAQSEPSGLNDTEEVAFVDWPAARRLQEQVGNARQVAVVLTSIEPEQIVLVGIRQQAAGGLRVQEDSRLHERDRALIEPELLGRALEHASESAGLHGGLLEWRVLRAVPEFPAVGIAADVALIVLQLDEIQGPLAENEEIDLRPCAVAVDKLEVAPSLERASIRKQFADVL